MDTPKEALQELETRIKSILDSMPKAIQSVEGVSYDCILTWGEDSYNVGVLMGELDSAIQNIEAQLQIITERDK